MTEQEWLQAANPWKMLAFLEDKASGRKLQLFACACCRRVWYLLADERHRKAVEVAERLSDGIATVDEVGETYKEVSRISLDGSINTTEEIQRLVAHAVLLTISITVGFLKYDDGSRRMTPRLSPIYAAQTASDLAARATALAGRLVFDLRKSQQLQSSLLHDLFGKPFRSTMISPAILAWNDGISVRLAQTAYEERHLPDGTLDNGRLAILADALEEAGYTDADILGHLRGPGPHVRGCWAVGLCLGKE
jgi:hypothetical protein